MVKKSDREIESELRGDNRKQRDLETFQQIRDYIRNNPGCTTEQIAGALGIDEMVIIKFLKEGRLVKR